MPIIPALGRLWHEDDKFKAKKGYLRIPSQKKKQKKKDTYYFCVAIGEW
jgi:hypothetical protein